MNFKTLAVAAAIGAGAALPAQAIVQVNTTGLTTTYTENFNGGSSFTGGAWFDTLVGSDDYLWLSELAPTASYTFSSAVNIASLVLDFWYSVPNGSSGAVTLATLTALGDTPGNYGQYFLNNPGPGNSGAGAFDSFFSQTLTNLAAGSYTLTFSQLGGGLNALKVDDVSLTVTAVPEPETYALLLAGLGLMGFVASRRRPQQ